MIDLHSPFYTSEEQSLMTTFLEQGYIVFPLKRIDLLDQMKVLLLQMLNDFTGTHSISGQELKLEELHHSISPEKLNELRLHFIQQLSKNNEFKLNYYNCGKDLLHTLVGNELAMQRVCNLSIQMPQDKLSLLPLHADTWSGNSPYEVVFWLPFTNCYQTNSMYILPREKSKEIYQNFSDYKKFSSEELYQRLKNDFVWIEVPYGHGLIFSHTLLHGNRVNQEEHSRWSFNIRFKSLLTPYGDKAIGETFQPITMRPLTQLGFQYHEPKL